MPSSYVLPSSLTRLLPFSGNMTLTVSDDPSWYGPLLDPHRISSYFVGSWTASGIMTMTTQSDLAHGVAVASFVCVMYDWGEQERVSKNH